MKVWKRDKEHNTYLDVNTRDRPCIFIHNKLLFGRVGTTHAMLIQEQIYGMGFPNDVIDIDSILKHKTEGYGFDYYRSDIEDSGDYIFGHVIGKNIFWDIHRVERQMLYILRRYIRYDNEYVHYRIDENYTASKIKF